MEKREYIEGQLLLKDCLEVLQRCNALILCGNWRESRGCNQEYAADGKGNMVPVHRDCSFYVYRADETWRYSKKRRKK